MVGSRKFQEKIGIFDIINVALLSIITLTMLYPFINILIISFSSIEDVIKNSGFMLLPRSISFDSYKYVLHFYGLLDAYQVTLFITIVGTAINLVMTTIGAYVLSNKDMPGRNLFMTMIVITMFFNGGLIPNYLVVQKLGLIDNIWSLILPGTIIAFYLILMKNFFQSIPSSLKESARIDGSSELRILIKIMVPLSVPIVATLALFYGVSHWNEYSQAIIYINSENLRPMQVLIRAMYEQSNSEFLNSDSLPPPVDTVRSATVMVATIPIICVYPFLQKYFVSGIMIGSVKG